MWLSFLSNILVFVTATMLVRLNRDHLSDKYFIRFIYLTGLSSLFAAFGHLEIIELQLQNGLLLASRLLSLASIFNFVTGTVKYYEYHEFKWVSRTNVLTILTFTLWLLYQNIFLPVMYYGILGMAVVGLFIYIKNFSTNRSASWAMILGIVTLIASALVFSVFKNNAIIRPSDVSHVLIALSLAFLTRGFKQLEGYEITVRR